MKTTLDRLANHRFSTIAVAVKELSLEELEGLLKVISKRNSRTFKSKWELVNHEIQIRKSPTILPVLTAVVGFSN